MFYRLKEFWEEHGFTVLVIATILFLTFMYLFVNKNGTYDKYDLQALSSNTSLKQVYTALNRGTGKYIPSSNKPYNRPVENSQPKDSKLERATRAALENIFKRPFPKIRPDFLRNPVTGGNFNLELDCYNEELSLGVEINGIQHYKYVPYFHKNNEAFLNQKYRDEIKRHMCKNNNIILIEVPYTVKESEIYEFLIPQLKKFGYKV